MLSSIHGQVRLSREGCVLINEGRIRSKWWREIVNLASGDKGIGFLLI